MSPAESIPTPPDTPGPDEPDSSLSYGSNSHAIQVQAIYNTDITDTHLDGWLQRNLFNAIQLSGVIEAQVNLVVVGDKEMASLHEQYTGVPGTTDVLTFDLSDSNLDDSTSDCDDAPIRIEADIILCLDEAKRQASQRGHEPRVEMLLYAVHGLMHLLGEDDHEDDDYDRMHAREDDLLEQLGIGRVFNPEP